ncbi:MAG TPA: transcriptional regulator GutM [Acidimicrobiia bacterium]|nr:transcriptional regulator GutM [Acidimicrobiia bacterium]
MTTIILIVAVVAGWMVQTYFTYRQSMAFNRDVMALRNKGTVSVGVAGKRYRGGRAFVAIAIDDHGVVKDALTLTGFTTFSRAKTLPALFDVTTSRIHAEEQLPGLSPQQHEAARQAVDLARTLVPVPDRTEEAS